MKLKSKWVNVSIKTPSEGRPIRIINDAAVATGAIGDGRLIPLLILDLSERPDVEELIRVHQHLPPGDAVTQWCRLESTPERSVALSLKFVRPAEVRLILEFDSVRQGGMVDQILTARSLYIQSGKDGDRLLTTFNVPKILIEVPEVGFDEIWADFRLKYLVKELRERGLSRTEAKQAAKEFVRQWREFGKVRFQSVRGDSKKA